MNGNVAVVHIVARSQKESFILPSESYAPLFDPSDGIQGHVFTVCIAKTELKTAQERRVRVVFSRAVRISSLCFFPSATSRADKPGEELKKLGGTMIGRNLEGCPLERGGVHAGSSIYTAWRGARAGSRWKCVPRERECILFINEPSPRRRSCLPR